MVLSNNIVIGKTILDRAPELLTFLMKYPDETDRTSYKKAGFKDLFLEIKKIVLRKEWEVSDVGEDLFKLSWYVITTTPMDNNLMYIMSGAELLRTWIDVRSLRVLGIAGSAGEGRELVGRIMEECIADGALDQMKEYLESF